MGIDKADGKLLSVNMDDRSNIFFSSLCNPFCDALFIEQVGIVYSFIVAMAYLLIIATIRRLVEQDETVNHLTAGYVRYTGSCQMIL